LIGFSARGPFFDVGLAEDEIIDAIVGHPSDTELDGPAFPRMRGRKFQSRGILRFSHKLSRVSERVSQCDDTAAQ
jgi:hypothetical protein